jgi:hypothetical protein
MAGAQAALAFRSAVAAREQKETMFSLRNLVPFGRVSESKCDTL